jgi:hypothetical protein
MRAFGTTAAVHLYRQGDDRRPWLVWVHGAGQGQPLDLLFSRARRIQSELGFNIVLPVQPGHGLRRKAWPAYPNMDPLANVAGMMRPMGTLGPRRRRRTAIGDGGAVGVTGRSAGCRADAAARASSHRRRLARPNGVAGARTYAARAVGWGTVLARRQPRGTPLLPARAGGVGAIPGRTQCGRRPPIVRVTCSA